MATKYMRVAAHRGFSEKYPENTMEAFRAALEAGADEIETDVRVSADGELVLIHDETADRTTDGTGKICEMTLAELKKLDAGIKKGAEFVYFKGKNKIYAYFSISVFLLAFPIVI